MDYSINGGENTGQLFGKKPGSKPHILYQNKIQKCHQKLMLEREIIKIVEND